MVSLWVPLLEKKKIMDVSLKTFISSVFWTERLGPACALEFIKNYRKNRVNFKLIRIGKKVKQIWEKSAKKHDLKIEISGLDPLASFSLQYKNWPTILTFFIQEMLLKHKIIASSRCYANLKHTEKLLKYYAESVDKVFKKIKFHLKNGNIEKFIKGPVKQMGFNRLTK